MPEVNCDIVKAELQDYLDGELDPTEHRAVAAHLQSCETCAHEARLLSTTRQLLRNLPNLEPENEYWDFAARKVLRKIPSHKPRFKITVVK